MLLGSTPIDDFLASADATSTAERVQRFGVVVGVVGVVLAVGVGVFLVTVWRPVVGGERRLVVTCLVGGALAAAGGVVEALAVASIRSISFTDVVGGEGGTAAMLRIVGGTLIALGLVEGLLARPVDETAERWRLPATAVFALAGMVVAVLSFGFDGHTVSEGPRALHAVADAVHVTAGAVWAGGIVAIALLAVRRHPGDGVGVWWTLLHGFSAVATVALVAVTVAGVAMALFVLDDAGQLTGTPWGRLLLVKVAVVGVAAAFGAYQRFRVIPRLGGDTPNGLARVVVGEAVVLIAVVVLTGFLTTASTL